MGLISDLIGLPWNIQEVHWKMPGECCGFWAKCYACDSVGWKREGYVGAVPMGRFRASSEPKHWSPHWFCKDCKEKALSDEEASGYEDQIDALKTRWFHLSYHGEG